MSCKHGNHVDDCELCDVENELWRKYAKERDECDTLRARVAELERELNAIRKDCDRYKAWCEAVMAQPDAGWLCVTPDGSDAQAACREFVRDDYRRFGRVIAPMIVRPQPLKENE